MTDMLFGDAEDALSLVDASTSARNLLSSFLGDSTFVGLPAFFSSAASQQSLLNSLPTDLLAAATSRSPVLVDDLPSVESEALADLSHVALDLITFAGPTRALLRLSICVGRLLAIAADWVPDHYLHPEELAFQLFMLSVSVGLLLRSAFPFVPALLRQSTTNPYGEKRAYGALFKRHGGLSWVQTRMVLAGGGAEWFELGEGEVVVMERMEQLQQQAVTASTDDNDGDATVVSIGDGYLYWLQKGEAELLVCSGDTCLSKERAVATAADADEVAILGELEFARRMQDQAKASKKMDKAGKKKKDKKSKKQHKDEVMVTEMASTNAKDSTSTDLPASTTTSTTTAAAPTTTKIRAGPSGATLLRLDAVRLLRLMEDDDALAEGIRSIVFAGMQEKLLRVMAEDSNSAPKEEEMQPSYNASYEPEF